MASPIDTSLTPYIPGRIWLRKYPIHYAGCDFFARASFVRLAKGEVMVHSPCPCDERTLAGVREIGEVAHIVAPGSYHYFHAAAWQQAFPEAITWACPGVERKRPALRIDGFLSDVPPPAWEAELDQALVRGNRFIWEIAFVDKPSKTLILTDLLENIGDTTEGTNWVLRFWWKVVFNMWGKPKPAPEYQMGWNDKQAARRSLERILAWDFERIILSHGDNIERDARQTLRKAWARPLSFEVA